MRQAVLDHTPISKLFASTKLAQFLRGGKLGFNFPERPLVFNSLLPFFHVTPSFLYLTTGQNTETSLLRLIFGGFKYTKVYDNLFTH